MPKGYWIARVEVRDAEGYKEYVAAAKLAFDNFELKFLARGGPYEFAEGAGRARKCERQERGDPSHASAHPRLPVARARDRA